MIHVVYTFSQNNNLPSFVEKNRLASVFITGLGFAEYSNVHTILIVTTGMSQLNVVTKFSRSPKGKDAFTERPAVFVEGQTLMD